MSLAKKKVVVAGIREGNGDYVRIPLFTSADVVHVMALAMGYKAEIAFSFGVLSRSVPQWKTGELDITPGIAAKVIRLAALVNDCRITGQVPEDNLMRDNITTVTRHVRTIETCYSRMVSAHPHLLEYFAQQYQEWRSKTPPRTNLFRRVINFLTFHREQKKHS